MKSGVYNLNSGVRDFNETFASMVSMNNHIVKCAPIVIKYHVLI